MMERKLSSPKKEEDTPKSARVSKGDDYPKSSSRTSQRSDKSVQKGNRKTHREPHSVKSSGRNSRRSTKSASRNSKADISPELKKSSTSSPRSIEDGHSPGRGDGQRGLYLSTGVDIEGNSLDAIETVLHANQFGNKLMVEEDMTLKLSEEDDEGWDTDLEDASEYK